MSRESELYKDKIEVSLDGRQIFYLFFGGAVIVGLVFVLGVMVGRRVEARGHVDHVKSQPALDPLAALDQLEGGNGLSFQGALRGADMPKPDVEKQIDERAAHEEPVAKKAEPKADKVDAKADKVDAKADKVEAKAQAKPDAKADKVEAKADDKPRPRFTLQLSSFQDKSDAESYLSQLKANGQSSAYVTEAGVDGKTFYRVRLGNYRSLDAANDAKADFEKSSKKSASVMKL
jgi:cell division protein FtsN